MTLLMSEVDYIIEEVDDKISEYQLKNGKKPTHLALGLVQRQAIKMEYEQEYKTKNGSPLEVSKYWGIPVIKLEEIILCGELRNE